MTKKDGFVKTLMNDKEMSLSSRKNGRKHQADIFENAQIKCQIN